MWHDNEGKNNVSVHEMRSEGEGMCPLKSGGDFGRTWHASKRTALGSPVPM